MLYTRKLPDCSLAEIPVGGITIYGETQDQIMSAIAAVMDEIDGSLADHLCMNKRGFKGKVCTSISAEHPERVFSAIFGLMVSEGRVQIAECLAMNGSSYRAYFLSAKRNILERALEAAFVRILKSSSCALKDVEVILFGKRAWGTWTQTSMIVDILASNGLVSHVNRFEIKLSPGSQHAASKLQQCEFNVLGGIMASGGLQR
jgi:hypothetical protein